MIQDFEKKYEDQQQKRNLMRGDDAKDKIKDNFA